MNMLTILSKLIAPQTSLINLCEQRPKEEYCKILTKDEYKYKLQSVLNNSDGQEQINDENQIILYKSTNIDEIFIVKNIAVKLLHDHETMINEIFGDYSSEYELIAYIT